MGALSLLELKQHRENKLQSVNHNPFTIHQHVTSVNFQEQGETMNVDTLMPLGLSLEEVEMQRTTKRPRMLGFKTSRRGVEKIKKVRERELHRLEAMVGVPFTLGPRATSVGEWGGRQCGRDHSMFYCGGRTCVWKIETKIRTQRERERDTKRYNSIIKSMCNSYK